MSALPPENQEEQNRTDRLMKVVPQALSSKTHIFFLGALLVYLVILPLIHAYTPSPSTMLIGGNWTNVTSDIGACIAAGSSLKVLAGARKRSQMTDASHKLAVATHKIMADLYHARTGVAHPAEIREITGLRE